MVVSQAKSQGLVAATQVVYLPQVPLDVPLPPPQIVRGAGGRHAPSTHAAGQRHAAAKPAATAPRRRPATATDHRTTPVHRRPPSTTASAAAQR